MTTKPQSTTEPPDRIWLPADTSADDWNILAKNPSRNWSTDEPANNIEYARVSAGVGPTVEDDDALIRLLLNWRRWYSENIFSPWTIEEAQRVHAQFPNAVDRISADSARGTIDNIIEDIRAGRHRAAVSPVAPCRTVD